MTTPRPDAPERDWIRLTSDPLATDAALAWATTPAAGAVVCFLGVVRDHAEGRAGVHSMTYEAYEEPAVRSLHDVATSARTRWPAVERIALWHRVGTLSLSEASVVVVVSSAHRDVAFDAARHCIDTLKHRAPIWKKEHWAGGEAWALGATPLRAAPEPAGANRRELEA